MEPSVLLAIVSGVANAALAVSFSQGAVIAWWRAVLHGASLRDLHYIWSFGRLSFRPTLRFSNAVLRIAVVALLVTLATLVSNPLLQRASRVKTGTVHSDVSLSIDLMKNPLAQAYGVVQNGVPANTLLLTTFIKQVQSWYQGMDVMASNNTGYICHGTCQGSIAVPGVEANCSTSTAYMDFNNTENNGQPLFSIEFGRRLNTDGITILSLDVVRAASVADNCIATMVVERCDILTALVERTVTIHNGTITLEPTSQQILTRFASTFDFIDSADASWVGPLAMLEWLGNYYFSSNFTLDYSLKGLIGTIAKGVVPFGQKYEGLNYNASAPGCASSFTSPTADIIHAMEDVLFRCAFNPGMPNFVMEPQAFSASQATPTLVFSSNYKYLGIAVAVMVIGLAATLIPLWGWWQLGRTVDLSPLETANAFGAPLMRKKTVMDDRNDLVSAIGDVRVKYCRNTDSRLEISETDQVEVVLDGGHVTETVYPKP